MARERGKEDRRERGERNEEKASVIPLCIAQQLVNTIKIGGYYSRW